MKSRKASLQMTFNIAMLIPRLIFMILVTLCIVMLVRTFLIMNIDVAETEGNIMINRFLYAPDCIAYTDEELSRVMPGIVDLEKFKTDVIEHCIYYGEQNDYAAAKLVLHFLDTDDEKTLVYNQIGYDALLPRVDASGPGGTRGFYDSRYVLVKDGEELRRAMLDIEVLTPNI